MEEAKPIREVLQQIAFECQESGATKWQVMKILKELESEEGSDSHLKRKAAEILEKLNPEAAKTFLSFEKLKVYTSTEKREPFDRGNIIRSLTKETSISRHVAEKIGSEVEDKIKDLKLDYLNTQLIREMVNVKLLELGHEDVHTEYARLGMPVSDVKKKLSSGEFENEEILREYNWLATIPKKARELHFDSFIHIHSPADYSTKIFAAARFIEGDSADISLQASRWDKFCTTPLVLKALNFSLAGRKGAAKKKLSQECAQFTKTLSVTGKQRVAELSLFTDFEWQNLAEKKKNATGFANAFLAQKSEAAKYFVSLDSKYQLKLLQKGVLEKKILIANNSRERTICYPHATITGNYTGILQLTGVNLKKILDAFGGREEYFFEKLEEIGKTIEELVENKRKYIVARSSEEKLAREGTCGGISLSGLYIVSSSLNPENESKAAERIITTLQKYGSVCQMNREESQACFSLQDDMQATEKILLGLNSKQRRTYGFTYSAASLKEAENLFGDCPCIELSPKYEEHKGQ